VDVTTAVSRASFPVGNYYQYTDFDEANLHEICNADSAFIIERKGATMTTWRVSFQSPCHEKPETK